MTDDELRALAKAATGPYIALGMAFFARDTRIATLEAENKRLRDALAAVQSIAAENLEQASRAYMGFTALNAASFMRGWAQATSQKIDDIARAALATETQT